MSDRERELLACVDQALDLTPGTATLDSPLDQLAGDSLGFLALMVEVKEKFGQIPNRELVALRTPRDVLAYYGRAA